MMRIERIRSTNLTGLGDVDLIFPVGPALLCFEDRSRQKKLGDLLLELFYNSKNPLAAKSQSCNGIVEVWMVGQNTRFHIQRQFVQRSNGLEQSPDLVIKDETGRQISFPETMTLGEFLFRVKQEAFRLGGVLEWPRSGENDTFFRRSRNMRQGGDEGFSLAKVRASLAGAQKRVEEQTESMALVKAEYDALRHEWEEAHRQQERERLLLIEIKNLQEKEKVLSERINQAEKMQERLTVLRQNTDYRELRQLQGELTRLEELCQELESNLTALTRESQVDWAMIESLREECLEWAGFQEQVNLIASDSQILAREIYETQNSLQTSGYQGMSENEVQALRRAEEERRAAQEELEPELENLVVLKSELEKIQIVRTNEITKLQALSGMAGVTEAAETRIARRERLLALWRNSQIGSFLDQTLREKLSVTSISDRLSLRLTKYYQNYNVSNFKEFTCQLEDFRVLRQQVERLQMELELLQEKVRWEEKLRKIVNSCNTMLKRAFRTAKVADFPAWLNGWEDHQQKKIQIDLWQDELRLKLEQQTREEKKMATSTERLREKLGIWENITSDRDEVLAEVMNIARQLRTKDEAEREAAVFSEKFNDMLGDRNIEQLAKILEPLADLERETRLSGEDSLAELTARQNERVETRQQLEVAEQSLLCTRKFPALSVLEKKIEAVKRQWIAFEVLHGALDGAQALLENSWQEWKTKYGKDLKLEKQWILSQMSTSSVKGTLGINGTERKKDYFANRMAIAQLAIRDNSEVPLLFSVGEENEGQSFWEEVLGYLRKLSLSRQVVFTTADAKLWQKLVADGWSRLLI